MTGVEMNTEKITIPCHLETLAGVFFKAGNSQKSSVPCIIICHGAFEHKENFFELADYLCKSGIYSIAIDMPGHGDSTGDRFHINIDLWVQSISATIDWLVMQPYIDENRIGAFGFSSGGTAVFEAALTESRLKALITLDATVKNYLNLWDTIAFKILTALGRIKYGLTGSGLRLNLVHVLKNAQVAYDPVINHSIISDQRMIDAYSAFPLPGAAPCAFVDTIKRIHGISIPTLVMHGEDDHIDPPKTAEMIFKTLTCEKSLEFLPQSGHCGYLDTQKHKIMKLTTDWALKRL